MLALTYHGPNRIRVDKSRNRSSNIRTTSCFGSPALQSAGLISTFCTGIVPDTRVGCTFGHEFAGVVEELGPVGLFAQKSAWLMGAGRVIAVDYLDYRLEFARRYNKVETINFRETNDVVSLIQRLTDGRGADVCIDAVGCEARGSLAQTIFGRANGGQRQCLAGI